MSPTARNLSCLLANLLLTGGALIFAIGFFPHKPFLPGLAEWQDTSLKRTSAPFDRVVFMVVDALRNDFVYGNASNFAFTQELIRSGAAVPLTGHASAPTITMPRVKAITTGSVPSFLDVVLNFAESDTTSTLATQDTWLAQMKSKEDGKLVMYGDDTWLHLFPGFFERSDGTTSFFVSDFTEVDTNVTRHVPEELSKDDWNVLVLHFLGLDHIGHKTGPRGPNMSAKQKEMDVVVKQIYEAMLTLAHLQSSLLVLLGDHGMNDGGNHGGSSSGEVSTALLFISPNFRAAFEGVDSPVLGVEDFRYYEKVEQSDIAPTLAALLGFPIPRNNLGIVIPKILELWTEESDRFEILYENALQMHEIVLASFSSPLDNGEVLEKCDNGGSSDVEKLSCSWLKVEQAAKTVKSGICTAQESLPSLLAYLKLAQEVLSGTASNYDLVKMRTGIGLAGISSLFAMFVAFPEMTYSNFDGVAFVTLVFTYSVTMFASSYVEEEHQFWYWALSGWLVLVICKDLRHSGNIPRTNDFAMAAVSILFGIARRWNQTGQKYAGGPDLVSEVFAYHTAILWGMIISTYAIISRNLSSRARSWMSAGQLAVLPVVICIAAFAFKVAFTAADAPELLDRMPFLAPLVETLSRYSLVSLARAFYLGLIHLLGCAIYYEAPWQSNAHQRRFMEMLHNIVSLFLITQARTANIPIFLIFIWQLALLDLFSDFTTTGLAITSILFQYSSFFVLGGTNSISSVDLSNAYNGVSGYNVGAVGFLTFVSNWAGPIWWTSATCLLKSKRSELEHGGSGTFGLLTMFATFSTLAVMVACTVLREHLFIWTVFSPKYLYTLAWMVAQHVLVNGIFSMVVLGGI